MQPENTLLTPDLIFDQDWESKIKPTGATSYTTEGNFKCLESITRLILGQFVPVTGGGAPSDILSGKRDPPTMGGPNHRVMLLREDSDNLYVYVGHAFLLDSGGFNAMVMGRRLTIAKPAVLQFIDSGNEASTAKAEGSEGDEPSGQASASEETKAATKDTGSEEDEPSGGSAETVEKAAIPLALADDEWVGTRPPT